MAETEEYIYATLDYIFNSGKDKHHVHLFAADELDLSSTSRRYVYYESSSRNLGVGIVRSRTDKTATFTFHITDGRLHKGRLETHAIEGYCYSLISDYSEAKFYEQNVELLQEFTVKQESSSPNKFALSYADTPYGEYIMKNRNGTLKPMRGTDPPFYFYIEIAESQN